MTKRSKYREIGDDLDTGTAYIQATRALDVAAFLAEENRDIEGLLSVAQTYVAIGERLTPGFHEDEEDDGPDPHFGFTSAIAEVTIDPEEPEFDEFEDEEGDEVQD